MHPRRLSGLALFQVASRIEGAVGVGPAVLEFLEPMGDDATADERVWQSLAHEEFNPYTDGETSESISPEVLAVLRTTRREARLGGSAQSARLCASAAI